MRGSDRRSGELFSYVDVERRIRRDHPLRSIRGVVNEALDALSGSLRRFTGARAGPRSRRRCCCENDAAAGILLDPVRAPVDGAA